MHAVNQRRALGFQCFGGGDVGLDHELLDQPHRVQTLRRGDARDHAIVADIDLALGQVQFQRRAFLARYVESGPRGPQRFQDAVFDRCRWAWIAGPIDCRLCLLVAEFCGGPHQPARKCVAALFAVLVEHHPYREHRAQFATFERAQIVGDLLRQHRHHAVGEVDRIAALFCFAAEISAGPHIERYIGDGDDADPATGISGRNVGSGPDRVIVVAGVDGVDGDQRDMRQVFASGWGQLGQVVQLTQHPVGELIRDAVRVHRNQADLALVQGVPQPLDNSCAR